MPTFDILRQCDISSSFRVDQVRGMFELDMENIKHEWKGEIPIHEKPWQIGLIVGASGSGKTTIAKEIFPSMDFHEGFQWPKDKAVLDGFPAEIPAKDICAAFNSVGFSSPPSWLKPFHVLSNGQKFRAELARALLCCKNGVIFDEFTSVVDRTVAQIGSAAVAKAIRKGDRPPFIAVSCHYDIIDWLDPDWIFDVSSMRFEWRERRRFPEIKIDIRKSDFRCWYYFREHHYLSHTVLKSAQFLVAYHNDNPIGVMATCHFPHPKVRNFKRGHRLVVLPDYQGIGIGQKLHEWVAQKALDDGYRYIQNSSNPAVMHHCNKSPRWVLKNFGRLNKNCMENLGNGKGTATSCRRITASFEYIGSKKGEKP